MLYVDSLHFKLPILTLPDEFTYVELVQVNYLSVNFIVIKLKGFNNSFIPNHGIQSWLIAYEQG